jgi:hypothetical protein
MSWRKELGDAGERAVIHELGARGWTVTDLNTGRAEPNVDLIAAKAERTVYIQVKTYNDYRWISGGSVNSEVCAGGPIFNRSKSARYHCTHLVCVTPATPGDKKKIRNDWRFFVMPLEDAERLFRVNADGYYNTPKLNGKPKVKKGACRILWDLLQSL